MKRIALIPAYQPEKTMRETVFGLRQAGFTVVLVDDGSGAAFAQQFASMPEDVTVLTHAENRGKGAALKTGMAYIRENCTPPYLLVTADADGQHRVEDIIRVCEAASEHPDSLVLGSRRLDSDVPLRSKLGNTVTRFVFRLSSGVRVYDTQTGLRAFSWKLLPQMREIAGQRYEYEMNVLMALAKNHTEILEIPIQTVYLHGNASSHFNTVKDSYRIYKEILKFSASSLLSFCADYFLFCLLLACFGNVTIANVLARVGSGTLNFTLNRKMVFQSDRSLPRTAAGYIALAAGILFCNTVLVNLFCGVGIPAYLAKILTELLLFAVSWSVQHLLIFGRRVSK